MANMQQLECLKALATTRGYPIIIENGQRIYGPLKSLQFYCPPNGSEVFMCNLPRDIFEDALVPLFEQIGTIFKLRLLMCFSGQNRGFGFVEYLNPEDANMAIQLLDGFHIRKGCPITLMPSLNKHRLYVGGLPREITKRTFTEAIKGVWDGVVQVTVKVPPINGDALAHNAYAFIEFKDHSTTIIAKKNICDIQQMYGQQIMVRWAFLEPAVNPQIMCQVKRLFVSNVPPEKTNEEIHTLCRSVIPNCDVIYILKGPNYAILDFGSRAAAERGLEFLNGLMFGGKELEVVWARPINYSNRNQRGGLDHFANVRVPRNHFMSYPSSSVWENSCY